MLMRMVLRIEKVLKENETVKLYNFKKASKILKCFDLEEEFIEEL